MTEPSQRYVSEELSHFVGRGYPQQTQYEVLLKILRSGLLTYSPDEPNKTYGEIVIHPDAKISENELYYPGMVCLCDIPVQDLAIHMRKYSSFASRFRKTWSSGKVALQSTTFQGMQGYGHQNVCPVRERTSLPRKAFALEGHRLNVKKKIGRPPLRPSISTKCFRDTVRS